MQCFVYMTYIFIVCYGYPCKENQLESLSLPEIIENVDITENIDNKYNPSLEDNQTCTEKNKNDQTLKIRIPKTYAVFTVSEEKNDKELTIQNEYSQNFLLTTTKTPIVHLTKISDKVKVIEIPSHKFKNVHSNNDKLINDVKQQIPNQPWTVNRKSEIILNPTIILNIQDAKPQFSSPISQTEYKNIRPDNVFNIRQVIRLENVYGMERSDRSTDSEDTNNLNKTEVPITVEKDIPKIDATASKDNVIENTTAL